MVCTLQSLIITVSYSTHIQLLITNSQVIVRMLQLTVGYNTYVTITNY